MSASPACRSWPLPIHAAGAAGVLRITLKCASPEADVCPARRRPAAVLPAWPDQSGAAALRAAGRTRHLRRLRRQCGGSRAGHRARQRIEPVGFSPDEALLPWSARGFSGFRLLTEYFAFPEKFLFFDFAAHRHQDHGSGRQPVGDLRLSRPVRGRNWNAASANKRSRLAARRWSTCSRNAASRSADPHRHRISHRAGRPTAARRGDLERHACRETLPDGSFRPWRPFHRLKHATPGG